MASLSLLTYATAGFEPQRQALVASARAVGFDRTITLGPEDIQNSEFWARNGATLAQPRGAGYWLWKPHVILEQLVRMPADDVLLYADAGRDRYYSFTRRPDAIAEHVRSLKQGFLCGVLVPQFGPVMRWTKRDCLILMGCDAPEFWVRPTVQATWSAWRNTPASIAFLEAWLEAASDPRCLTDLPSTLAPEHDGFVDHRHDQAICTLLAYKQDAPYVDLTSTGVYRWLQLRPQSRLAQTYLKRPQHSDDLLRGVPAVAGLAMGQLRFRQSGTR